LALLATLVVGCGSPTYDLTVHVTDEQGNALLGAMVGLSQNGETLLTNQEGQVTWTDLEQEQASLVVVAAGYRLQSSVISLEEGANDITFPLAKQPDVPYEPPDS
jgi:hypothetical protein